MKVVKQVVKQVAPDCPCTAKVWEFYNAQADEDGNPTMGIGSIVQCDCGSQYTLAESQRDGKYWIKRATRSSLVVG